MKKRSSFAALIFMLFAVVSNGPIVAQDLTAKVNKIKSNAFRLTGVGRAFYSPSGKFLAVQASSKFVVFPARTLETSLDNFENAKFNEGRMIGFTPSETLLYSNPEGIHAFDPLTRTSRKLFSGNQAVKLNENIEDESAIVIASDDLIVTGDGSYDWGENKGNIYKYDLKTKRVAKGAVIWAFWYASLSPSGRYVLYEHGAEENNNTDLYDIRQNKNFPVSEYFNFRQNFPEFKETDEMPVAWLKNGDRFLALISASGDDETEERNYLALFDVPDKKIIWKKLTDKWFFPTEFQQVNAKTAFLSLGEGIYELSLENGEISANPKIDGEQIAVSPDGEKAAFIRSNRLFIASPDGRSQKPILDLPADWKWQTAYKAMGERPPFWSAGNKSLILFGENELLVVLNLD